METQCVCVCNIGMIHFNSDTEKFHYRGQCQYNLVVCFLLLVILN